jgi:hypothetical protein
MAKKTREVQNTTATACDPAIYMYEKGGVMVQIPNAQL